MLDTCVTIMAQTGETHVALSTRYELLAMAKLAKHWPGLRFTHVGGRKAFDIIAMDKNGMPVMAFEVKAMNFASKDPAIAMHKAQIKRKRKFIRNNKILGIKFKPVMVAIDWITHEVRIGKGLKCWRVKFMEGL